jgi:hypothetical protein
LYPDLQVGYLGSFVIKFRDMDELRFYQRPWFLLISPPILVFLFYILATPPDTDPYTFFLGIIRDLVVYIIILLLWLAFFAQFVLPVHSFKDRQKIFDRLLAYLTGTHGPAIFVRNGNPVKGEGEERKKGLGVLWLDSASGLVTRTDAAFKNTFGPGVHFIERNERVAGYVDLHIQSHEIGPRENDKPFEKKTKEQSEEEYKTVQNRRTETSGLTRDGIEVVPSINVLFKIDADPVRDNTQPGSRFGFSEEAVRLAITGEAINPKISKDSAHRYQVPWNQLPALIAADVWRDLLSKFTLNDLFERKFTLPPSIPNAPPQTPDEGPLYNPVVPQSKSADFVTGILRESNHILVGLSKWVNQKCKPKRKMPLEMTPAKKKKAKEKKDKKVTGLQVINFLLKERLQKQRTAVLDEYGNYIPDQEEPSGEHQLLQSRGIRVLSARVGNPRLPKEVDDKLINQWTANWLRRARIEREKLEQQEGHNALFGEEDALRYYILQLSEDLISQANQGRASELRGTLRALMLESRAILVNESRQFRQGSPERDSLEEIIQWLETRDL